MKRPFAALLLLLVAASARAQPAQKPLIWGADASGGVPYAFADPADPEKTIGFEVDLAEALSRELGRPIEFQQRNFDTLLNDIERGDIDLAMNGLEILPDRLERVRFTKPYYLYQLQLIVKDDSDIQSLADIKEKKLSVGTLRGSAAVRVLEKEGIPVKEYDGQDDAFAPLRGGEIAGVLYDVPIAVYYAAPDKSLPFRRVNPGVRFAGPAFAEGVYGIAVHKDNEALQNDLNKALDRLRDSGELKRILQKWQVWTPDQYRLAGLADVQAAASSIVFDKYMPLLLDGALMTVLISTASMALAITLGLFVAIARLYGPAPVRVLAVVYVEFFRGIPVLLLLVFLYYGLPTFPPYLKLDAHVAAILAFGLNYGAYEAEIYRAGILSIPLGQWEAAASLGMPPPLTFRRIVLPQAFRVILPPMTNDFVALFKDTSVVSVIAVAELTFQYQKLTKSGGSFLEIGLATAALYLIMSVPLGHLSRYLEHRWGSK